MTERVVLIGDSIRMGYQAVVRQALADVATVWAPEENGFDSRNVLAHLDAWVFAQAPTVVHLNCGLHDVKRDRDTQAIATPLPVYQDTVRQILERVLQGTEARVIWATITPVDEAQHRRCKDFDRYTADVDAYNQAALEVVTALGVPVDDLSSVVAGDARCAQKDGVHYTEDGYAVLGAAVARAIRGGIRQD